MLLKRPNQNQEMTSQRGIYVYFPITLHGAAVRPSTPQPLLFVPLQLLAVDYPKVTKIVSDSMHVDAFGHCQPESLLERQVLWKMSLLQSRLGLEEKNDRRFQHLDCP